jgi:hypothetical protein
LQRLPFWIFFTPQPPRAATHYGGYSYKVSWSLMKGIKIFFKSPLHPWQTPDMKIERVLTGFLIGWNRSKSPFKAFRSYDQFNTTT